MRGADPGPAAPLKGPAAAGRRRRRAGAAGLAAMLLAGPAGGGPLPTPHVPVREVVLANGLRLLLVSQPGSPLVAAGWVVRAGAAADPPGRSGLAHFVEHLLAREPIAGIPEPPALLYSRAGAVGRNALTLPDFTLYHVRVPADRLELWFRLEAARLAGPSLAAVAAERPILEEERRLRAGATPGAVLDQELARRFWGRGHPYAGPVLGLPEEVERLDRRAAAGYFAAHYRPERITAALVGGFDSAAAAAHAERTLGRLAAGPPVPASPLPGPPQRTREEWVEASFPGPPRARLLYPAPAFGDPGAAALDLAAALFNGRAGRLHRSLVVAQGIAFAAWVQVHAFAGAGWLQVELEASGETDPAALVAAFDREANRLLAGPPPAAELERARGRLLADGWRRLREPGGLLQQLLVYDALGGWRHLDDWPAALLAAGPAEVAAAAGEALRRERRLVGVYRAGEATGWRPIPPPPGAAP